MPKKRAEKEIPAHMERLPPALSLMDYLRQFGRGDNDIMYEPITNDDFVHDLLRRVLGIEGDVTRAALMHLADSEAVPTTPASKEVFRKRHQAHIETLRADFEKTKNPLCAWDAFSICRRKKKFIPYWVLAYFDDAAKRMLYAENTPEDLPYIMGFRRKKAEICSGGRQAWTQYHNHVIRRGALAHVVNFLRDEGPASIESACVYAAEQMEKGGVKSKWESIRKWYYKDFPDT